MASPARNAKDLLGYSIHATDGDIGKVIDLYFDDERWAVRYLVVDTGGWLTGRKVLISPRAVTEANRDDKVLPVSLTKDQVKHSPDIDTDKPVSRQHEAEHLGYYEYPFYWGGSGLWGMGEYPGDLSSQTVIEAELRANEDAHAPKPDASVDSHLRSFKAVSSSHVNTTGGEVAEIEDLLVDQRSWAIRDVVVTVGGKQMHLPPTAISL